MTAIEPSAGPVRRLEWRRAKVRQVIVETSRVKSLLLEVAGWQGHLPGQHADIRLTGEDGYQAQRSYSIASPPEDGLIALTVERVENGEVSPYLVDELREADQFELRGPIGGYFVWTIAMGGPLMSHRGRIGNRAPYGDAASPRQAEQPRPRRALAFVQEPGRRDLPNRT